MTMENSQSSSTRQTSPRDIRKTRKVKTIWIERADFGPREPEMPTKELIALYDDNKKAPKGTYAILDKAMRPIAKMEAGKVYEPIELDAIDDGKPGLPLVDGKHFPDLVAKCDCTEECDKPLFTCRNRKNPERDDSSVKTVCDCCQGCNPTERDFVRDLTRDGDVEKNPGPNRNGKKIAIKANKVSVSGPRSAPKPRRRPRRPRRPKQAVDPITTQIFERTPEAGGTLTNEVVPGLRARVSKLTSETLDINPDNTGWYFKYLDPAGATESGRALGEFSKIPDGLCKFSVDAEMRSIYNEECPLVQHGGVPLDGKNWSITVFSLPMFRANYIAIANTDDEEITQSMVSSVCSQINYLNDWYETSRSGSWNKLPGTNTYWKIRNNPPMADMPEPINSAVRTVSDYRLTYKGMTIESNAPTLVDQGYWIGGHYAISPKELPLISEDEFAKMSTGVISVTTEEGSRHRVEIRAHLTIEGSVPSHWTVTAVQLNLWHFARVPAAPNYAPTWVSFKLNEGSTLRYRPRGEIFADHEDTVGLAMQWETADRHNLKIILRSSRDGQDDIELIVPSFTVWSDRDFQLASVNEGGEGVDGGARLMKTFELPPSEINEIAANNPKVEQFLTKESGGAYLVHSKIRNPVFQLVNSGAYGVVKFRSPDGADFGDDTGVRDTVDANFSTAVASFRGISQAQTLVIKTFAGWEGVTTQNTPFGQFAHCGLLKNDEILNAADNLATSLTGVYPANDNFAAVVASFAASALSGLLKGQSSASVVQGLCESAVSAAQSSLPTVVPKILGGLGKVAGRIIGRIRARRARRRA